MTWTTTLPTQPGVYWYRSREGESLICEIAEPTPGDFWVHARCRHSFRLKGLTGFEWQGPIRPLETVHFTAIEHTDESGLTYKTYVPKESQ